jgi:hypothetical protein
MPAAATVVTPCRFAQGLTYVDFLAGAAVNRDKFEHNYSNSILNESDLAFFRSVAQRPQGPAQAACHC